MQFVYFVMSKTEMGDLIACAHCRNAWEEMEMLDKAFEQIVAKASDYPMHNWNELKRTMPSWKRSRHNMEGSNGNELAEIDLGWTDGIFAV
jgi:2-dehydropantoate 2-reductase